MNFSINDKSANEVLDFILPSVMQIFNNFKYLEISKEEYQNIILKIIENSPKDYSDKDSYIAYVSKEATNSLMRVTSKLLKNKHSALKILNSYINAKDNTVSFKNALFLFDELNTFFRTYNYIPSEKLIIELLDKNIKFKNMTELVFNKYKYLVKLGEFESTNNLLKIVMDIYLTSNDLLEIERELKEEMPSPIDLNIDDSMKMYLIEIGRIPLLTLEEERDLARKTSKGDSSSRSKLIESNLRLVVSIARKYQNMGLSLPDLVQEGNIGLIKAVDTYDMKRGTKFSTHAFYLIRGSITRAIANKGRTIRIPSFTLIKFMKYKKRVTALESMMNRSLTLDEIAEKLQMSHEEVYSMESIRNDTLSINETLNEEEDSELGDFIPSLDIGPEDLLTYKSLKKEIILTLENSTLKERDVKIAIERLGLDDSKGKGTLEEIGKKYKVTYERVRQIQNKAIKIITANWKTISGDSEVPALYKKKIKTKDNK